MTILPPSGGQVSVPGTGAGFRSALLWSVRARVHEHPRALMWAVQETDRGARDSRALLEEPLHSLPLQGLTLIPLFVSPTSPLPHFSQFRSVLCSQAPVLTELLDGVPSQFSPCPSSLQCLGGSGSGLRRLSWSSPRLSYAT